MNSKTKALTAVAGLTAVLAGKACYDNVTLIEGSLDPDPFLIWRLGSKNYVITKSLVGPTSVFLNLDYSTYYNNGWLTCSSGPSYPNRWSKKFSIGDRIISIEMNNYFANPDDFFPCMHSSNFQTYKIAP